jgi:hypothetical protein
MRTTNHQELGHSQAKSPTSKLTHATLMKKKQFDLQKAVRSILAGSMFVIVAQGPATASTWLKLVEFESPPYNYIIYMNSATFNRKGKTASAMVEVSGTSTSGAIDKENYQYIADCSLWRYKKNSNGAWKVAAKDSPSDQVNSFLCSSSRIKQTDTNNTTEKGNETRVKVQIEPPSATEIIKQRMINNLLNNMGL